MIHDLQAISGQFQILGDFVDARPWGSGHIHDSFAVTFNQAGAPVRYLVQRINHQVFKDVPAMMENIVRATRHIRQKLAENGTTEISRRVLTLIPTREGESFTRDAQGNFWRAWLFIEKARTHDVLETVRQAYEAAKAFGETQRWLRDLPAPPLHETIPNFHHGPLRYQAFLEALALDPCNRAANARPEIDFLQRQAGIFEVVPRLIRLGEIPIRITHNDTKLNNVLLDEQSGQGICVIDLDTLMPGVSLYDFGDIVRSSVSPAAEDEPDLSKVVFLAPRFEALARGFLSAVGDFLNHAEWDYLALGGPLFALIMGARFLTDYLLGDPYYKITRAQHNLDRCRTQFKLMEALNRQEEVMRAMVEGIRREITNGTSGGVSPNWS